MNMEQLKAEWRQYDQKLALSGRLNAQLVLTMLKERSASRVTRIRRNNTIYLGVMVVNLALMTVIFTANPFDFQYRLQYIPFIVLTAGILLIMLSLYKSLQSFNIHLNKLNLESFLRKTVAEYAKTKKIQTWCRIITLSGGALTVLSFLPGKLENKNQWLAMSETALILAIILFLYLAAFKSGLFGNRSREEFENDLKEWNDLKTIAAELDAVRL